MAFDLLNKIPSQFKNYKIKKIESGASKRFFYRLFKDSHTVICMDSREEKEEYKNYIKIHSYLSKVNVSIPDIYDRNDDNNI